MGQLRHRQDTVPGRLQLLLPWLNGDPVGSVELRLRLLGFVASFDGSPAASHIEVRLTRLAARLDEPQPAPTASLAEQVEALRLAVRAVLLADDVADARSFPSLQFGIRRLPPPPKRSRLTTRERRMSQDAGAAVLCVEGSLSDLVPFLFMHVLTTSSALALMRCPAPQAGQPTHRCGRWFIQRAGVGRPQEFCSHRCRQRAFTAKPPPRVILGRSKK